MSDVGNSEGKSIYTKINNATSSSFAEMQFKAIVGEVGKDVVAAVTDLDVANKLVLDIIENPFNFDAQKLLTQYVDDNILSCDPKRLADGMDAYAYGAGKSDKLEEDELQDADYYKENIVFPILQRYGVTEENLNKVHSEKSKAFRRNITGQMSK